MSKTVVIIEDNPNSSKLAKKLVTAANYEAFVAEDGETGYDMVLDHQPDIVLIDLGLPDIDGQTVVALLRQHPDMEKTPLIAFTAYPPSTAQEMAKAYGCDGVIIKPIDTRTFVQQIESFLDVEKPSETGG